MRLVKIAAVQIPGMPTGATNEEKCTASFRAAEHWLDQAGQRGADIACLGETFNLLGQHKDLNASVTLATGIADDAVQRFGDIARRYHMNVIIPLACLINGIPRNAALMLDRGGKQIGEYFKVHCTEDERARGIVPGDHWPTFSFDFGTVGVQICHDASFVESARILTLKGAEIIFWPHTMSGWGDALMDIMMQAPAVYNGIFHVPVCFGCEAEQAWRPGMLIGRSSIIGPDGITLADAGRRIGLAMAEVDLDSPRIAHDFTRSGEYNWRKDMLRDRRPETYDRISSRDANAETSSGTQEQSEKL